MLHPSDKLIVYKWLKAHAQEIRKSRTPKTTVAWQVSQETGLHVTERVIENLCARKGLAIFPVKRSPVSRMAVRIRELEEEVLELKNQIARHKRAMLQV